MVDRYTSNDFPSFLQRVTTFVIPVFFPGQKRHFEMGSTLKGKNLLQKEQILFFKSYPKFRREAKMKIAQLLPLREYLCTVIETYPKCSQYNSGDFLFHRVTQYI